MPIGGSNIAWDNTTPPDTESAGLGDDRIRSLKSSIQEGLNNEHNWSSGGGANTGYHLPGSARAFYATQSLVSSSGTDARLMQTSDTSRLFHVGSAGTSLIGGATIISAGSYPGTTPQRHYWALEFGEGVTNSSGSSVVLIPNSGFSGIPFTLVTQTNTPLVGSAKVLWVGAMTATQFNVSSVNLSGSGLATNFYWYSIGSRVL